MPDDRLVNNVEQSFIQTALKQNMRIDGRKANEFRNINITFGGDWGSVMISLGETKVLAQVRCEIGEPKATRPNEGALFINVEMGEVACLDPDTYDTEILLLNRLLERTFRESHCVDLESLCVRSEDYVWVLRVDVTVLNHEGNLNDAASAAVLAALMHFRRPDVSIIDDNLRMYRPDEKDYIPVSLQHFPVTVSHCVYNNGRNALADPLLQEETVAESHIIFGFNSYNEMCTLNLSGSTLTDISALKQCAHVASKRATEVVNLVKKALEQDLQKREENEFVGLSTLIKSADREENQSIKNVSIRLRHFNKNEPMVTQATSDSVYEVLPDISVEMKELGTNEEQETQSTGNKWLPPDVNDESGSDSDNQDDIHLISEGE